MIGKWSSRSAQLEALLDEAFELESEARAGFLAAIESELREDLALLLKADTGPSPLDRSWASLIEALLSVEDDAPGTFDAGQ